MTPNGQEQANKFISPFIRSLAIQENITIDELYKINGTGDGGRITKEDIITFLENRKPLENRVAPKIVVSEPEKPVANTVKPQSNADVEYVELTRLRKLISANMLRSVQTAPHVTSFVEVNVTHLANWRTRNKAAFAARYGENLTFLPFFIEAAAKALKAYPNINASLQGDFLAVKKHINIGIATALPDGNLIVPVITDADQLGISGLALKVSDLGKRARQSALKPNEIQGGTFTITNVGSFGNIGGTPIINQPELAILAIGTIVKKPVAVLHGEEYGIAIQDMVELWLSYDHRVVDGAMGGSFLKQIADNLLEFDIAREI